MRKRTWLWCAIAALTLSLNVACDESDVKDIIDDITPTPTVTDTLPVTPPDPTQPNPTEPDPTMPAPFPTIPNPDPTIQVPESTVWEDVIEMLNTEATIAYEGGEVTFVTRTNQTWWIEIESGVNWLTITDPGRAVADYTIKVAVEKNISKTPRTATITICYDDAADTRIPVTVSQEARPATATIPLSLELPNTPDYNNVGSNYSVAELIAGSDPNMEPQLGYENENGEYVWQNWSVTDGWYGMEGPMNWGAGCIICVKPNADGSFGFISCYPGVAIGTEITLFINYGNDVIVEVSAIVTGEEVEQVEYQIVETREIEHTVTFVDGHGTVAETYTLDMAGIKTLLGGDPTEYLMSLASGEFQDWSRTDGWFGAEGATSWGGGSAVFCMKPQSDGTFASQCCHPNVGGELPAVGKVTFRYANASTKKAVDLKFTINVVQ